MVAKCKTPPFSRPWMAAFLADALKSADVVGSMARAKIGWGDYLRGRRLDPRFELACQEIDLIVRHALLIQLEAKAAAGDFRSAKLLAGQLREVREALAGQGVATGSESQPGDDRFPGRVHLGHRYPEGPCLQCLSGLVVLIPWCDGDGHEIVVRHVDSEWMALPLPFGWETARVLTGISPDPSKLVLIPDGPELEDEGD
jgi:hypothetical protein